MWKLPRIVVVQSEPPPGAEAAWLAVGVKAWYGAGRRLTIIVKGVLDFGGAGAAGAGGVATPRWWWDGARLSVGEPSSLAGARADELAYPSDFAPRKRRADV